MNEWSKEDLEEMCGDDIIDQLAFLSGCHKHKLINDKEVPDGWIIPDEVLRKFAELIVRKCTNMLPADTIRNEDGVHMFYVIREHFGVPTIGR